MRKFYEYARNFEASSFKGLHEFLEYVNGIIERGTRITDEDAASSETVRVMTVHKSKGLEFPVVFLIGTDKASSDQDSKKNVVISTSDYPGIACKVSSETGDFQLDSPFRISLAGRIADKSSDEEIRILYVALTRARDNLYVVASGKEGFAEKKIAGAYRKAAIGGRFGIKSSGRWIDRILLGLAASPDNKSYTIDLPDIIGEAAESEAIVSKKDIDPVKVDEIYKKLKPSLQFEYPYSDTSQIPAKISVSKLYPELLNEITDDESLIIKAENLETKKPRFLDDAVNSAERGTATHLFMQFCKFENLSPDDKAVKEEIARLVSEKFITSEVAEIIRIKDIVKFAQSDLIKNLRHSDKIYRELRFNVFIPASEFTTDKNLKSAYEGEKILVQGVIDLCYFTNDGKLILCDYKTDRIPSELRNDRDAIRQMFELNHGRQLKYYSYAIEEIFGRKPDDVLIYSLAYGDAFHINV
jgi:ATP-dependent helicase/nuclease subunit A